MPNPTVRAADLPALIGSTYRSDWLAIGQDRVDAFADLTEDRQWIHIDVARATREMGGTVAHGFLTLSLLTAMARRILDVTDYARALNYGFDKVRFTAPVKVGDRIRLGMTIAAADPRGDGGILLRRDCVIEVEGSERPALVAEWLTIVYP